MSQTSCKISMRMKPSTLQAIDAVKKDQGFIEYDDVFGFLIRAGLHCYYKHEEDLSNIEEFNDIKVIKNE